MANERLMPTQTQDAHLQTVVEVLQSIKASEMTPMLQRIYTSDGGSELLDVLMKYLWVVFPLPLPRSLSSLPCLLASHGRPPFRSILTGVADEPGTRAWRPPRPAPHE